MHTGATTIITIMSALGQVYDTSVALIVGGITVLPSNLVSVASVTRQNSIGTLTTALENIWTMTISSTDVTASVGDTITQAGYTTWTVTIPSEALTATAADISVTQTGTNGVGTLAVALDGSAITTITIRSAIGQTFDTAAELVIGGGSGFTVAQAKLQTATSVTTPNAAGTLRTALTGAGMVSIVIDAASGVSFHTTENIVLTVDNNAVPIPSASIITAMHTGATTIITITSALGQVYDTSVALIVGGITVLPSNLVSVASTATATQVFASHESFLCSDVNNINNNDHTSFVSSGNFNCSLLMEFAYKGVSTYTENDEGTPTSVLFKVKNQSTTVTTSGDVLHVIAEGDLIKLETRTYVVDDVSSNHYGTYVLGLMSSFQAGDMDVL